MIGPGPRTGMYWCKCGIGFRMLLVFKIHVRDNGDGHYEVAERTY